MRLRYFAAATWLGAAVFTVFFASQLLSADLRTAIDNRSSITVKAQLLAEPTKEQRQLGSSARYRTQVRLLEPVGFSGAVGSLSGNEKLLGLHEGDSFTGSITLRPAFGYGMSFSSNLRNIRSIQRGVGSDPIATVRNTFLANLSGVSTDSAALVAGLAIGDDSQLSQKTKDNFKVVSLTHLSAVSGANCAIVLAGVAMLLNLLPMARFIKIGLSFSVIGLYLALVGQQASVLRASVMVGAVLLGLLFGRRVAPLDAISLSVILLMFYEPALSMDSGFALSALATLGLLVLAPRLVPIL
jgi:competence protein ComEC